MKHPKLQNILINFFFPFVSLTSQDNSGVNNLNNLNNKTVFYDFIININNNNYNTTIIVSYLEGNVCRLAIRIPSKYSQGRLL